MSNPRFVMIGGFLGAGKTTTIAKLARQYMAKGLTVGIVTNDQTTDLVDTNSLRAQGFEVGEVAGSCFCCNFNALTSTVEKLGKDERPDVIIAEPVGSCTDLVATVVRPLVQIYEQPLDVAPYGVIIKPSHGAKILRNETGGGSRSYSGREKRLTPAVPLPCLSKLSRLRPPAAGGGAQYWAHCFYWNRRRPP